MLLVTIESGKREVSVAPPKKRLVNKRARGEDLWLQACPICYCGFTDRDIGCQTAPFIRSKR